MASDFSNVERTIYSTAHEQVLQKAKTAPSYAIISTPIVEDALIVTEAEVFGGTVYAAKTGVGSPTADDLDSAKTSTTIGKFEKEYVFTRAEWEQDLPGVQEQIAGGVDLGYLSMEQDYWEAWGTLTSTTHPYNSETWLTAVGGGTCYYCDNLQIDPPNESAFTQSNTGSTALSDAAVSANIISHMQFLGWNGQPWATTGKPYLVYNPALAHTAEKMLARTMEQQAGNNSGTPVVLEPTGARLAGGVPIEGLTSYSSVDWYTVWVQENKRFRPDGSSFIVRSCPIQIWIRRFPFVSNIEWRSNDVYVTFYAEWAIHYGARTWDIIHNDV